MAINSGSNSAATITLPAQMIATGGNKVTGNKRASEPKSKRAPCALVCVDRLTLLSMRAKDGGSAPAT